jgi:hypothetical protein
MNFNFMEEVKCLGIQPVFTLRYFDRTNFYKEVHALVFVCDPNENSIVTKSRPNKHECVRKEAETDERNSAQCVSRSALT